jgi:hypothetical protein
MNLPTAVAGRTQPTVAVPGLPANQVSIQTIGHQAAGIDLACAGCSSSAVALKDITTPGLPMWAKVLMGLTAVSLVLTIVNLAARRSRA